MVAGHKTPDGKFHPHNKNKAINLTKKGSVRFDTPVDFKNARDLINHKTKAHPTQKVTDIVSFDELDESGKEKAREWFRQTLNDFDWYAEDEGILYDTESNPQFAGHDVFKDVIPKSWDVERGRFVTFDLDFKPDGSKKLAKYLGISPRLEHDIEISFAEVSGGGYNTSIIFTDLVSGYETGVFTNYSEYLEEVEDVPKNERMSEKEFHSLESAHDKWESLMEKSFSNLRNNYEHQFTDEYVDDAIEANEYTFDRDGNREDE